MHFKTNLSTLGGAFLLLFVTQACHADLMCYICDDCAQITANTPQELCNEDFFNAGGTTLPSTQTTTEMSTSTTTSATTPTTTTTLETTSSSMSTTEEAESTTTEEDTTEYISTEAPIPTPPTVGPPMTTTGMPTPPNQGTVIVPIGEMVNENGSSIHSNSSGFNTTTPMMSTTAIPATTRAYMNSSEIRVRQLRSVVDTDVTYHCYRVQKSENGILTTSRGCSRVTAQQGVCQQMEGANANASSNVKKCFACSTKLCNSSSSLGVSMMALLVGVVAALLRHN